MKSTRHLKSLDDMVDPFDDITIEPDPLAVSIDALLKWVREDYGSGFESLVIKELMELARHRPQWPLQAVIDAIALDWSK